YRAAARYAVGECAIEGAVERARREGNRVAVRVQQGELIAKIPCHSTGERNRAREAVILQAQPARKGGGIGAALEIAVIAVDVALFQGAQIDRGLDLPIVVQPRLAVQRQAADRVPRGLRESVDRPGTA